MRLDELFSQRFLVLWGLPGHIENLLARADEFFRLAMALQAPLHIQCLCFPHQRHLVDLAVAGLAADSLVDVDAVVEVNEIGQVVDPVPGDGRIVPEAGAHRFEHGRFAPDLGMAGHAGFCGRDAGKGALFDGGVAVATVESHAGDVVLVAERDGLIQGNIDPGDEVGAVAVEDDSRQDTSKDDDYDDAGFGCPIGGVWEYLSHLNFVQFSFVRKSRRCKPFSGY